VIFRPRREDAVRARLNEEKINAIADSAGLNPDALLVLLPTRQHPGGRAAHGNDG
jgi:hypothetical protein